MATSKGDASKAGKLLGKKSTSATVKSVAASAALFAASASAISVWQQCGGKGWSGSGSCDSGSYCSHQNDYYWQCIPGSGSTTLATTTRPASTTTSKAPSTSQAPTTTSKAPSSGVPTTTSKAPSSSAPTTKAPTATTGGSSPGTTASVSGNPFAGKQIYANPYYASEINSIAIPSLPASLAPAASAVANVGTFVWL